jgi:hypothetical protein
MLTSKSCVRSADVDRDGDIDLFVGGRVMPGRYPEPQESFILINDGAGHFKNIAPSIIPAVMQGGMVTDAEWTDLNKDSWPDLIVTGEFMPVRVFINDSGNFLKEATNSWFEVPETGFWNQITVTDLDKDGNMDIVAGNFGTNSQMKASPEQPVELYFKDFDNNGSVDPIFTYYVQGKSYPFASRLELLTQLNSLRRKFPDYSSYSEALITDIFPEEDLKTATHYVANELKTLLFMNTGSKFEKKSLPPEAQFAPVYAIEIVDYNNDGNKDLILAGNNSAMCVRLGVMDANYGQLYEGDGKGNFSYVPQTVSGLSIIGDVRSMKMMSVQGYPFLLAGINNVGFVTYYLKGSVTVTNQK